MLLHSLLDSLLQHLLSPSPSSTDTVLQAKVTIMYELYVSLFRNSFGNFKWGKKLYENIWWEHQVMHTKGGRKGGLLCVCFP